MKWHSVLNWNRLCWDCSPCERNNLIILFWSETLGKGTKNTDLMVLLFIKCLLPRHWIIERALQQWDCKITIEPELCKFGQTSETTSISRRRAVIDKSFEIQNFIFLFRALSYIDSHDSICYLVWPTLSILRHKND